MRTCATCSEAAIIRQHVAGDANDPDLVTYQCAACARWTDRALVVLGVRLRHDGPRPPAEIAYARCAGMAALLTIALGPDPRIVRTLRVVAGEVGTILGAYVGPDPGMTGPLPEVPANRKVSPGLARLIGAPPSPDPFRAFEAYCRRMVREARR